MSDAIFRGDCGRCAALCCHELSFDRGAQFAFDKPAGAPCRHLDEHACAIHHRLAAAGMGGCAAYDCRGAGQLATAMFAGLDLTAPSTRRARAHAFALLREIQALRLVLARSGHEIVPPATYGELLQFDLAELRQRAASLLRASRLTRVA
jgi:hypothetical protein